MGLLSIEPGQVAEGGLGVGRKRGGKASLDTR